MASNILKGTVRVNPNQATRQRITQIQWKCPPKFTMDPNWFVAAGEESTEAVAQRPASPDRRPYAELHEASDQFDSRTPVIPIIPIEEEGALLNNNSAPFLTTAAMGDETMSLAVAALNASASCQGEPPIDMDMFMQWLNNSETVHKYLCGQSVPGITPVPMLKGPTLSVPFVSSNPDQLNTSDNCVQANTDVVISKPRDVEMVIREYEARDRSGKPSITGASSVPREMFSSVVTASNEMSLMDEDIPLPKETMAAVLPLYSSSSANWESNLKTERMINESAIVSDMRMEPRPREGIISPMVSFSLPQSELSEFSRASAQTTTDRLPFLLHRNPPLPEMHLDPVSGASASIPIPRTELATSLCPDSSLRTDLVTSPKVCQQSTVI